ncbi:hypothetical protein ACP6PL_11230 [Dapis sp. BLCC M126]|uniref:hypothetical protein n=1 Tax=Dapis sp. BLCC M126 TaxID=3400189 RepID=UPI003CEA2C85
MEQFIGQVLHDRYRIQSVLGGQTGRRTFLANDLHRTYAVQRIFVIATDREAISNPSFSYLMRKSCYKQIC